MKWLVLIALLSGCTAKTYSDRENYRGDTQSTYDVWEFEIISAYEKAGQRYRVAVVNDRRYVEPVIEAEGADGLDETTRKSIPVGQSKRLTLPDLHLRSIHSREPIEVRALKGTEGVIANVTHLRSCPVTTSEREQTSIVGDSSKGIITIPKLKTVTLREFTSPPCADPSDRTLVLKEPTPKADAPTGPVSTPTVPSAEILAAQKKSAEEAAETQFQQKLSQRIEELKRDFKKAAMSMPFEPKTPIEEAFCPRLAGEMRAAGITVIELQRREESRVDRSGYTEIKYESTATLQPMNVKFADGDVSRAATLFLSIKPDTRGCVEAKLVSEQSNYSRDELNKVAEELTTIIRRHQNGVYYERAMKDLGRSTH